MCSKIFLKHHIGKCSNILVGRSMYMQQHTRFFKESLHKNTFYHFLNICKTNWLRFIFVVDIVNKDIKDLIDEKRKNIFLIELVKPFDNRTLTGKKRKLAQTKALGTMMTLLELRKVASSNTHTMRNN